MKKAVESLEKEEEKKSFKNKTADEMIIELKSQLLKEEERATKFKNELYESEDRERKLKERIKEIDAINKNPIEEAKNQITSLEGVVAELKSRLKFTEQNDREEILQLKQLLKDKEAKLEILDREFESYKHSKNDKPLTTLLIDNSKIKSEAERWFYRGLYEVNIEKKVIYYSEAIDLNHDDANFYRNRGHAYKKLKEYTKALNDFNKAIELNPNDKVAYNTRGTVYFRIKDYEKAAADYSNALKLDPDYIISYGNLAELYVVKGDYENALQVIYNSLSRSPKIENLAIIIYLECIARKMLDLDISESEKKFAAILKKDFKTTWSFDNFELWLSTANIDDDKKAFIIEKTECLKEHTDIMDKN
ncbi:MAG: tetratricopeptide repeat protein [Acidobacteria bacterium]|nr:tetratricopeptide repeat protein [Acidobacteriota bacterium]